MNIIPLIVLGYERDRHISGLHFLAAKKPGAIIKQIYLALSNEDPYKSIAEKNAEHMKGIISLLFPEANIEKIPFNSFKLQDITEFVSYVLEKEEGKGEVWIDLTSTTKEVISLSTFFTLFGARIYWVTSPLVKGETRIRERVLRNFEATKKAFLDSLKDLILGLEKVKTEDEKKERIESFFQATVEGYLEATMEQYKTRRAIRIAEMPMKTVEKRGTLLKSIRLKEIHKELLSRLKAEDLALKDLVSTDEEYTPMATRYALMNLDSIGFLRVRKGKYSLTEIGKGYAAGIERAKMSNPTP